MIKGMDLYGVFADFLAFWQRHFTEQQTMTREDALSQVDDARHGMTNTSARDQDMVGYQNGVAAGHMENMVLTI
jgi:hypothetical protein